MYKVARLLQLSVNIVVECVEVIQTRFQIFKTCTVFQFLK